MRQNKCERWNSNLLLYIDTLGSLPSDALRHSTYAFVHDIRKRHLCVYTFAYVIPKAPKNEQEIRSPTKSNKMNVRPCLRALQSEYKAMVELHNKYSEQGFGMRTCTKTQTKTHKRKTNCACTHAC